MSTKEAKKPAEKLSLQGLNAKIESLDSSLVKIIELVTAGNATKADVAPIAGKGPEDTKRDADIKSAGPSFETVNPHWEAIAKTTLGSALERCEVMYPKNGGTIFTVVIKKEKSNAPKDYMALMKEDRRSREIGQEGIQGVELWCKLVAQNLKRNQPVT